jgi:cephalosporin-C deacetylase-like acetyl esterase
MRIVGEHIMLGALLFAPVLRAQDLVATPHDKSGIYRKGETVGWTIAVANGQQASPGLYSYKVMRNGAVQIGAGTLDLASGTQKIETKMDTAGMVIVDITPPSNATQAFGNPSTGGKGRVRLGAAVDPTHILPTEPAPSDFDQFWTSKLALLDRVPMNVQLTQKESGVAGVDYYIVRMDNIQGAHIYGQLAKPSRDGKFPAMMQLQWAGVYPLQREWITQRAAQGWLVFNIEAHDLPGDMPQAFYDQMPTLIRNYNSIYDDDRDRNYFLRMYLGDYRAVEYLASRPEWDGKTLVATGTSMGGHQSLAVAGLNAKVTHVVVDVPAGGDANASLHGHMVGYPNWDSKNARVAETARYFDVVNFAARIKVPTMIAMGFIDDVTPAIGQWTEFNMLQGVKEAVPMVESGHNHLATPAQHMAWTTRSRVWLDALLKGEMPVIPK